MLEKDALVPCILIGSVIYVASQIPILLPSPDEITPPPTESSPTHSESPVVQHDKIAEESSPITSEDSVLVEAKKIKVPRPPNAFIIYRKHHHASTAAAHPGVHNNQICESEFQ
jgi:hypothetical protein